MVFLAVAVAALALTVAALVCTSVLDRPPAGLVRTNFRGKQIPSWVGSSSWPGCWPRGGFGAEI